MKAERLEILEVFPSKKINNKRQPPKAKVKCYCGNIFICNKYAILYGKTKSCGCLFKQIRKNQKPSLKHGIIAKSKRIYNIYKAMHQRCYSEKCKSYKYYGGRGITICKSWHDINNFYNWSIRNGYKDDLTLDRIDVNGNYTPKNCRFVDMITQANNKRNNRIINYHGEDFTLSQLARKVKLPLQSIKNKMDRYDLTPDQLLSKDVGDLILKKKGLSESSNLRELIKEKIKKSGRTYTWLIKKLKSKNVKITNDDFSLKVNCHKLFTIEEEKIITEILIDLT